MGIAFPQVKEWKYVRNEPGKYPFQSAIELLKLGIIPAFDSYNKEWYLTHPLKGKPAEILWKGSLELVRSVV